MVRQDFGRRNCLDAEALEVVRLTAGTVSLSTSTLARFVIGSDGCFSFSNSPLLCNACGTG
jgi:hypothetical protein